MRNSLNPFFWGAKMEVWNRVMELLKDGKWHSIQEIQTELDLTEFKTKLLVTFLTSYDFCLPKSGRATTPPCPIMAVRLKPDVISFLEELDKIEASE